ncbi:MAG TPA: winged helix-turn-helix domain-containing protein, partial [Lachnospiraceae bacterium]|nr:winged helix-turn-helix domain-containing protein [Lachnospiraceae bacterium]
RKTGTLQVRNIWYEPGVRQTKKLQTALDAAIRRFAGFNDCTIISRSEGDGE